MVYINAIICLREVVFMAVPNRYTSVQFNAHISEADDAEIRKAMMRLSPITCRDYLLLLAGLINEGSIDKQVNDYRAKQVKLGDL
jgi:hypothetical protein